MINIVGTKEADAADPAGVTGAWTICEMQAVAFVLHSCPCGGSDMSPQLRIRELQSDHDA